MIYEYLDWIFGLEKETLHICHMLMRAFFVYCIGIGIILVNRRFIGERTPFDMMLKFIIGSMLANAITGNSPFFATVGMVFFLIFFNWLLSYVSFYNATIEQIVKGRSAVLYKNHTFNWKAMKRVHITKADVLSEIRKDAGLTELNNVDQVIFENTGEISVIPKAGPSLKSREKGEKDDEI